MCVMWLAQGTVQPADLVGQIATKLVVRRPLGIALRLIALITHGKRPLFGLCLLQLGQLLLIRFIGGNPGTCHSRRHAHGLPGVIALLPGLVGIRSVPVVLALVEPAGSGLYSQ
jgi:hypothetical protein